MKKPTAWFERSLLRDPDIKFGAENYQLLKELGAFVQQINEAGARSETDGSKPDIGGIEATGLDEGPTLLTLVRLAHAAGNRLVISIAEADGSGDCVEVLRI